MKEKNKYIYNFSKPGVQHFAKLRVHMWFKTMTTISGNCCSNNSKLKYQISGIKYNTGYRKFGIADR